MSNAERKRKERQRKLAAMTDEERKEFKSKENKRRSEMRRKQLNSMSKADLDAYRRKDATRKKKTVNPTAPDQSPLKCSKILHLSVTTGVSSLMEQFEFLAKFSTKEDIADSWLS